LEEEFDSASPIAADNEYVFFQATAFNVYVTGRSKQRERNAVLSERSDSTFEKPRTRGRGLRYPFLLRKLCRLLSLPIIR